MKGDERIRTAVPAPSADPVYERMEARWRELLNRADESDDTGHHCGHRSPSGLYICVKRTGHDGKHRMVWLDESLRRVLREGR